MKIRHIQTKLLLMLVPFFMIALLLLTGVSFYLAQGFLINSLDETARAVGIDYSNRIQLDMDKMVGQLEGVANTQRVRTAKDKTVIVEALAEGYKRFGIFEGPIATIS